MEKRIVHILGQEWTVLIGSKSQFPALENMDGYCDDSIRCIIVDDMESSKNDVSAKKDLAMHQKQVIRHEILHAFLFESGLDSNSLSTNAWAINEEMVDWFAIQLPKIMDACREALAL